MHGFDANELLVRFKLPILILLIGFILTGGGYFIYKSGIVSQTKVDVLGTETQILYTPQAQIAITAEIGGQVMNSGVYKLPSGSRVDDLIIASGGFTAKTDRSWTDKYLNRASKLTDGQKVYIPAINQQTDDTSANNKSVYQNMSSDDLSDSSRLVNINTASLSQLDSLPGIGPVFGQKIIEHRPYSNVSELLSKGVLKTALYNKVKELVTIY